MQKMIQVTNLTKKYGNFTAVDNLSFDVKKGSIFALLGENGAGKSTTISCLTTLLSANSGEVTIDGATLGVDDTHIQNAIGVVFQDSLLDRSLTVKENLYLRGRLYSLSKKEVQNQIKELARQLSMEEFLSQSYGTLSGGQRRRVDIARALLHKPTVLFLDEPTTGLDPLSRVQTWKAIKTLREQQQLTVFLTTHYMEEVENADDVLILDNGVKKAFGTPMELKQQFAPNILSLYDEIGKKTEITVAHSMEALEYLNEHKMSYHHFELRLGTMDDVFLHLTTKKREAAEK